MTVMAQELLAFLREHALALVLAGLMHAGLLAALVVGLPDISRGPGQDVDVPADGTGWPLILTDGRVGGGDVKRLTTVRQQMQTAFGLV